MPLRINFSDFSSIFSSTRPIVKREVNIVSRNGKYVKGDEFIGNSARVPSMSLLTDFLKSIFLNPNFRDIRPR